MRVHFSEILVKHRGYPQNVHEERQKHPLKARTICPDSKSKGWGGKTLRLAYMHSSGILAF